MKRKNIAINVFDIVLILVLLFVVLCSYLNVNKNRISTMFIKETPAEITLTVMIPEIPDESSIKKGDRLYFSNTGDYLGKVTEVNYIYKSTYKVYKEASIAKRDFTDEIVGLSIKLYAPLRTNENGAYVNESVFIAPGSEFQLLKKSGKEFTADVYNIVYREKQ